jgi:hypothetical protein
MRASALPAAQYAFRNAGAASKPLELAVHPLPITMHGISISFAVCITYLKDLYCKFIQLKATIPAAIEKLTAVGPSYAAVFGAVGDTNPIKKMTQWTGISGSRANRSPSRLVQPVRASQLCM